MFIFEEIYFTSIPCVPHSPLISKTMQALPGPNDLIRVVKTAEQFGKNLKTVHAKMIRYLPNSSVSITLPKKYFVQKSQTGNVLPNILRVIYANFFLSVWPHRRANYNN